MNMPPIVPPQEWQAAWEQMLVKEKELTHARDALAAERRRPSSRPFSASARTSSTAAAVRSGLRSGSPANRSSRLAEQAPA